jgi:hypothetical protein
MMRRVTFQAVPPLLSIQSKKSWFGRPEDVDKEQVIWMMGDWVIILLLMTPMLALGYLRYWLLKRSGRKNAASALAGVMIVMVGFGIYERHQWLTALHQDNPQSFRYSSNALVRSLYTPDTAPMTVTDTATAQEVFTYYRTDGAARLSAIEQPAANQWLATFSINVGEPQNAKLKGYFETEITDEARVLPLTRLFRSGFGKLRVEDVQTGQTLFSYDEKSPMRPVEMSKVESGTGVYEWQVRFTDAPGLHSQQAALAQQ